MALDTDADYSETPKKPLRRPKVERSRRAAKKDSLSNGADDEAGSLDAQSKSDTVDHRIRIKVDQVNDYFGYEPDQSADPVARLDELVNELIVKLEQEREANRGLEDEISEKNDKINQQAPWVKKGKEFAGDLTKLSQNTDCITKGVQKLKQDKARAEKTAKQLQEASNTLKQENKALKKENIGLMEERNALKVENDKLQYKTNRLETLLDGTNKFEGEFKAFKTDKDLEAANISLQQVNKSLKKANTGLMEKLNALKVDHSTLKFTKARFEEDFKAASKKSEEEVKRIKADNKNLEAAKDKAQARADHRARMMQTVDQENIDWRGNTEVMEARYIAAQERALAAEAEVRALRAGFQHPYGPQDVEEEEEEPYDYAEGIHTY